MTTADGAAAADGATVQPLALFGAIAAVTAWGSSGIIIRELSLSSTEIVIYRFSAYSVMIVIFMAVRRTPLSWRALKVAVWGGLALGLDVAFFFEAVKRTTIANATVIGAMQPIVVSIYGNRVYGEQISRRNIALAGLAIAGVVGVVFGGGDNASIDATGDLFAVGALFAWSAYFVVSKQVQGRITPTEYTAATAIITAVVNVAIALAIGTKFSAPTGDEWFWLAVLAVAAGVVGHSLMNWALVRIPLWLGSMTTLFIPVVATLLAWAILDEGLEPVQIAAMTAVFVALSFIISDQTKPIARRRRRNTVGQVLPETRE